jgi:hypothetical protein
MFTGHCFAAEPFRLSIRNPKRSGYLLIPREPGHIELVVGVDGFEFLGEAKAEVSGAGPVLVELATDSATIIGSSTPSRIPLAPSRPLALSAYNKGVPGEYHAAAQPAG